MASLVTLSTPPVSPVKPKSDENDNSAAKITKVTDLDKVTASVLAEVDKPKTLDKTPAPTVTKPKKVARLVNSIKSMKFLRVKNVTFIP